MVQPDRDVAYWVSVFQTDGSLTNDKGIPSISVSVHPKSSRMLSAFRRITKQKFGRDCKIFTDGRGFLRYKISAKGLMEDLQYLGIRPGDPPEPPIWVLNDMGLFGSYLAGVIDGDGDVRVKRKKYPQCVIRISSGSKPETLSNLIREKMGCYVGNTLRRGTKNIGSRDIEGSWWETEFYVSEKNSDFILKSVVPEIRIGYKREKIRKFIKR